MLELLGNLLNEKELEYKAGIGKADRDPYQVAKLVGQIDLLKQLMREARK